MRSQLAQPSFRKSQRERGSILVICMVLAALGTIGVAAWVSLLDARGHQVDANIAAMQHRAVTRNSKALAYRALYANHLHSNTPLNSAVTYTLPDNLGQCQIGSYSGSPLENASALRVSHNGGSPVRSFSTDVEVTLPHASGSESWQYQMRSYSPALGGDLLSIHPPLDYADTAPLVSGKLIVEGRAFFWDVLQSDFSGDFQADEILLPNEILGTTKFKNSSGKEVLPLNYPVALQTSGSSSSGSPYQGHLEVFDSSPNPHNSYYEKITQSGNYIVIGGKEKKAKGKGPDTRSPKIDDAEAEALIASMDPKDLVVELRKYLQLSTPVLTKVLEKNNPPFKEKELLQVLYDQASIANDVLTEIESTYENRLLEEDKFNFHEGNSTLYSSNANGRIKVFLRRADLPHLVLRNVSELHLFGQPSDTKDAEAKDLPPRIILVLNDATTTLNEVQIFHKNARRIALVIASDPAAPSTTRFTFRGNSNFPEWHGVIELLNTTAEFDASSISEAVIVGGIRSNQRIDVISGTLRIKQQFEPKGLETLLSRNAWIEAYQL